MSIDDLDVIDFITTKPGSVEIDLVVSDHWDWSDATRHCFQLQEKLNTYLAFVASGELHSRSEVQQIATPEICIIIIALHEPPATVRGFLEAVEAVINAEGCSFRFEHRPVQPALN